jgi:hypothetical protein
MFVHLVYVIVKRPKYHVLCNSTETFTIYSQQDTKYEKGINVCLGVFIYIYIYIYIYILYMYINLDTHISEIVLYKYTLDSREYAA